MPELRTDWQAVSHKGGRNLAGGSWGRSRGSRIFLALLRILLGSVFVWTFVDKTFGLGYSNSCQVLGGRRYTNRRIFEQP